MVAPHVLSAVVGGGEHACLVANRASCQMVAVIKVGALPAFESTVDKAAS